MRFYLQKISLWLGDIAMKLFSGDRYKYFILGEGWKINYLQ